MAVMYHHLGNDSSEPQVIIDYKYSEQSGRQASKQADAVILIESRSLN